MPQKINIKGDIGTAKVASDSYDVDNIYLTEEGWVYRHFKSTDESRWWDEIIVAGQVPDTDSPEATNPPKLGTVASPTFETGDGEYDIAYSSHTKTDDAPTQTDKIVAEGGGVPDGFLPGAPAPVPPAPVPPAPVPPTPTDVTVTFTGANGTDDYITAQGNDPSISIEVGATLTLVNNSGGHPVDVRVSDGGAQVTEGTLTGAPAGNGETLTWDTTGVTPGTYYYQCTVHSSMIGTITVS